VEILVKWTFNGGIEISQVWLKKIFICIKKKMNESLMGLE